MLNRGNEAATLRSGSKRLVAPQSSRRTDLTLMMPCWILLASIGNTKDMRDLSLVPILGIPSMYPGDPIHLIDDRPPSYLALLLRFITLSIKFSPVTSTAWLALLSQKFRENTWFKWLSSCLAASGPAWIKWGQWAGTS